MAEMTDINELRRLALDGDLAAMQEIIHRLEAAEKSDAESVAMYRKARDERDALRAALQHEAACVEAAKAEIAALRAKIEAMEKQEPVAWLHESRRDSDVVTSAVKHVWGKAAVGSMAAYSIPLYTSPGAQPAPIIPEGWKLVPIEPTPSVPTALLVAVANLVAQMEIVSRVGFLDTPSDKDSCAAFCVAEGSWLELMSAVESLASALAAAPEAKA